MISLEKTAHPIIMMLRSLALAFGAGGSTGAGGRWLLGLGNPRHQNPGNLESEYLVIFMRRSYIHSYIYTVYVYIYICIYMVCMPFRLPILFLQGEHSGNFRSTNTAIQSPRTRTSSNVQVLSDQERVRHHGISYYHSLAAK